MIKEIKSPTMRQGKSYKKNKLSVFYFVEFYRLTAVFNILDYQKLTIFR